MSTNPDPESEQARRLEAAAGQAAASKATQRAKRLSEQQMGSPQEILDYLGSPDLDSEKYGWVGEELGPANSPAWKYGNRSPAFEKKAELHPEVLAMMHLAEHRPGNALRGNREALAVMQGVPRRLSQEECTDPERIQDELRVPFSTQEARAVREAYMAEGNLRSLSIGGAAVDAATKARSETHVTRESSDSDSQTGGGLRATVGKYLG